jgi:cytochrome c
MPASIRKLLWLIPLGLGLAACGGSDQSASQVDSASADAAAPAVVEPPPDIDALLATADVKRGETLYFQCRACHTLNEGGAHKVGPNLYGLFGQKAGSAAGFSYSDAVKNSDIVWTPATVSAWLEQPAEFLPGNMMVFVGVRKPQDRANVIAFLQRETGD